MTRSIQLQRLFDAAEAAIRHSPHGSAGAKGAASLVFDRLRGAAGHDSAGAAPAVLPAVLPVCDHLSVALKQSHPSRAAVAQAFRDVARHLCWQRRSSARPGDGAFWHGHANAMLAGPGGLEDRDDLWIGATVMAPGVTYPDHSHPPEETYLSLTAGVWMNADTDWTDPGPDGLFHNPPGIIHSMRALPGQPFLALWFLPT